MNFKYFCYLFIPTQVIFSFISFIPFPSPFYIVFPSLESPGSEDSPLGSPHLVVNGNGSVNGQGVGSDGVLGLGPSPEGHQLSPLTSPLLMDAGCVRNDDEEEARRKVGSL